MIALFVVHFLFIGFHTHKAQKRPCMESLTQSYVKIMTHLVQRRKHVFVNTSCTHCITAIALFPALIKPVKETSANDSN